MHVNRHNVRGSHNDKICNSSQDALSLVIDRILYSLFNSGSANISKKEKKLLHHPHKLIYQLINAINYNHYRDVMRNVM